MALDDPELLAEFVTEAREHLAGVEGQLLDIESGGADINVDLVNTVFRAIHSVKGAAGFLGLTTVNKLAHSLENVLGKMRNRELPPTSPIVDTMLQAADVLAKLINNLETSNETDVSSHVAALDAINAGDAPVADEPTLDAAEEVVADAVPAVEVAIPTPTVAPAIEVTAAPATAYEPPAQQALNVAAPAAATAAAAATSAAQAAAPQGENSIRVSVGVLDS